MGLGTLLNCEKIVSIEFQRLYIRSLLLPSLLSKLKQSAGVLFRSKRRFKKKERGKNESRRFTVDFQSPSGQVHRLAAHRATPASRLPIYVWQLSAVNNINSKTGQGGEG